MPNEVQKETSIAQPMDNGERLLLRLSRYRKQLVTFRVLVDENGNIMLWSIVEELKIEGVIEASSTNR